MREFILVRDSLTSNLMLIRKSMICTVEEVFKDQKGVREITYVDLRPSDYVVDSMTDILKQLHADN